MADIFASRKQPSLFPMIVPCPVISKEDYHLFYKHERSLFTLLLVILQREVVQSMHVMGFLLWLEREGYTSDNLVQAIIKYLNPELINQLADEIVTCLRFLQKRPDNFTFEGSSCQYDILLLQRFLNRKALHLQDHYQNRDLIFDEVSIMANEISSRAFDDNLVESFIRCGGPSFMCSSGEANDGGGVGGSPYMGLEIGFHQAPAVRGRSQDAQFMRNNAMAQEYQCMVDLGGALNHGAQISPAFGLNPLYASVIENPEEEVPPKDRTIFLTFSKGYPISESEVREYFTRYI